MKSVDKLRRVFAPLVITTCMASACNSQAPSSDGLDSFRQAVQVSYQRLVAGKIRKKDGFFGECSVDFGSENGVRISETVCDKGENSGNITIRVTDPTSRPPSQKLAKLTVALSEEGEISLDRGSSERLSNGITLLFDQSGQSVELNGKLSFKP